MLGRRGRRAISAALAAAPWPRARAAAPIHGDASLPVPLVRAWRHASARNEVLRPMARSLCTVSSSSNEDNTTTSGMPATQQGGDEEGGGNVICKPKTEKDALFLRALRLFYEKEGHFFVPTSFVIPASTAEGDRHADACDVAVPTAEATGAAAENWPEDLWGLPLGVRVRNFSRGMVNDYKRDMLKSIGFPYDDWKTYVWEEHLLPSLRVFASIHGHTFVRFGFVVPHGDDRYPPLTWGYKLGFGVAMLRQQREILPAEQLELLSKLDFLWTENHYKLKTLLLPGLRRFQEIFGHTEVPAKFVVSSPDHESFWPPHLMDTKLGYLSSCLRNGFFESDMNNTTLRELEALGVYTQGRADAVWLRTVLPALTAFARMHGHNEIPDMFIVPSDTPDWPEETWGYELGYVVKCMLQGMAFTDQIAESKPALRALGYRWNVLYGRLARQLLPALRCFQALHGHCDVPSNFVVPVNDDRWPEEARKYHLGRQLQLLRKNGRSAPDVLDALDELDALGFTFDLVESEFQEKVLPALQVYTEKYSHCDVPRGFVVPADVSWPQRAWGFKLGTAANAIRNRKQYRKQIDEHRDQLQALGFVWTLPQTNVGVEREIVQPCVTRFREIYGAGEPIPPDFVVPSDDKRWPVETSGFKLGKWLQANQRRRRSTSEHDLASREMARSGIGAGITGTGSVASGHVARRARHSVPMELQPHQEEYWRDVVMASFQAYAQVHGSCHDIPDNFVVPGEVPYPQTAWGLNLGLRVRYIRHHDRYALEVEKYKAELETLGVLAGSEDRG